MYRRLREQARSHSGSVSFTKIATDAVPLWERACSRRRWHIQNQCCLTHRFRGQATLPQWLSVVHKNRNRRRPPVGAGLLAKAVAYSKSMLPDTPLSRASHAPTVVECRSQESQPTQVPCGSEPAREGVSWYTAPTPFGIRDGKACIPGSLHHSHRNSPCNR